MNHAPCLLRVTFSLRRIPVRPALLSALLLIAPLAATRAAEPAANDAPLELPKFTVNDPRELLPPESWRYAQVPGLEILSGASDRETQNLLRNFQLFNEAIDVVWPALKNGHAVPLVLVLCGPGKFNAFVPGEKDPQAGQASLLLRNPEHAALVLDLGKATAAVASSDADPMDAFDRSVPDGHVRIDRYAQLNHEYVRYLLSARQPRLPAWLEEGLAQLLIGMRVENRFIEFANLDNPNLAPITTRQNVDGKGFPVTRIEPDTMAMQARNSAMPLAEFFAVGHDSPAALNPFGKAWTRQAKGLVHMWLYGEGGRYNEGFARFVARAGREPVTEAMFRECFKMGYADMLMAFRIYTNDTAFKYQQFEVHKGTGLPEPAALALRDATPAEIGRIKGEAQLLAGHPDAAREEFIAPYIRGQADAALLASLGLFENSRGETARARQFLEASVRQQVVRPRAYVELARLRFASFQNPPTGPVPGLLSPDQASNILQPLLTARQQPPPLPETYELLADVLRHRATPPTKADLGMLNQGVILFQDRPVLLLSAAELNARYGDPAEARLMANRGLKLSQTPEAKQAFSEVLAALPQ